jgi:alkylated DNA nucleotide flippase Atl1
LIEMAMNYIGELIHEERIGRSMSFGDLARAVGATTPRQTSRIAQRLVLFERQGVRDLQLLRRVVAALDLDPDHVNELLRRQREEELAAWNAWADEPVPMTLFMRPFAAVWIKLALPVDIATDELRAMEYARQMTQGREDMRVVLAVNRRRAITFAHGETVGAREAAPDADVMPHMEIGGNQIVFEARGEKR